MKKILILLALLTAGTAIEGLAQKVLPSPKCVLTQTVGLTDITITYYRPGLKGRKLEQLAKPGKVWRTGANNATEFKVSNPITIGGKELPAGTYSLYSIPGDDEWTLIINKKLSWGTQYDEKQDVMRFPAKATRWDEKVETFTINISDIDKNGKDANLELRWGNVSVKAPFTVSK